MSLDWISQTEPGDTQFTCQLLLVSGYGIRARHNRMHATIQK